MSNKHLWCFLRLWSKWTLFSWISVYIPSKKDTCPYIHWLQSPWLELDRVSFNLHVFVHNRFWNSKKQITFNFHNYVQAYTYTAIYSFIINTYKIQDILFTSHIYNKHSFPAFLSPLFRVSISVFPIFYSQFHVAVLPFTTFCCCWFFQQLFWVFYLQLHELARAENYVQFRPYSICIAAYSPGLAPSRSLLNLRIFIYYDLIHHAGYCWTQFLRPANSKFRVQVFF